MKFDNTEPAYAKWLEQVMRQAGDLGVIFGLEDVHGLGRGLARYLQAAGHTVKFANAYLTKSERDEVNKTDRHDALAIARVTAKQILRLPDANLDPLQWALLSTVTYRKGLVAEQIRVKNRLHYLLQHAWPGWEGFFSEPFESKTALAFWEIYPSAGCLRGVSVTDLTDWLREQSHYALGQAKAELILGSPPEDFTPQPYQRERDTLVVQSILQLRNLAAQLAEVRQHLARLVTETDYELTDLPGIDVVLAAELIALVGDVTRFPTEAKFLAYTGIAPVTLGSGGHESRLKSQFGRRELSTLFHQIASTQLAVHKGTGVPRNPAAKAYYEKHLGD
jgi:transposase